MSSEVVELNTAKKNKAGYARVVEDGVVFMDLRTANSELQRAVLEVMSEKIGYHLARQYSNVYPMTELANHHDSLVEDLDNYGISNSKPVYSDFFTYIEDHVKEMQSMIASKIERGQIEFIDIPFIFTKGMEVITTHEGQEIGGIVEGTDLVSSFMGRYFKVKIKVIHNICGDVTEGIFSARVSSWPGLGELSKLSVRKLTEEDRARLSVRGEQFRKYMSGAHYVFYKGQLTRSSWWSDTTYRADGRVMIDVNSFQQVDNDQYSQETRSSGVDIDSHDRSSNKGPSIEVGDADLWRTYPFVYGFSFAAKQWGRMALSGVSEIKWRDDAFEKLVLPDEEKSLVRAIVENQADSFSDIIDGKGGGSIFLLHGPPGQGKTLTAETIAELLHRPLYAISVGELGVSPKELEETLRVILEVATIWNAVLLLDEADIFLEARDEKDIVRNAMVGVFLRLLEYHQGVLFLTTNRVKNIDEAFYSRISVGLMFESADVEKRRKIWENLLGAAGIEGINLDQMAAHDINGRQIKNIIRLAQTLAKSKGESVSNQLIEKVIALTTNFKAQTK